MGWLLLPVRRQEDILVFERRTLESSRRAEFRAVAIRRPGDADPVGTEATDYTDALKAACSEAVRTFEKLEPFLRSAGLHDDTALVSLLDAPDDAGVVDGSVLMTATLMLEYARQALVQESAVRRYEARAAQERFDIGLSASIYASLLRSHELPRGAALLDADLSEIPDSLMRHPEARYLLGLAATIYQRAGNRPAAIRMMEAMVRIDPDEDTLFRLGHLYNETGDARKAIATFERLEKKRPLNQNTSLIVGYLYGVIEQPARAIEAFLKAETQAPIGPVAARDLAWWLVGQGDLSAARHWANRAKDRGAEDLDDLFAHLDAAGLS